MPVLAVNVIKVLFVVALYAFLFYVARSMRGYVTGPPVETDARTQAATPQSRRSDDGSRPPDRSIVVFDEAGRRTEHPVRTTLVLGRGDSADVRLDDEYTSDRHASFTVVGNTIVVQDLGSTNGTTIDGQPIDGQVEVATGTAVIVGRTKVMVR